MRNSTDIADTLEYLKSKGFQFQSPNQWIKECNGTYRENVKDMDILIVYGDVLADIKNCDTVVIINGNVIGDINKCKKVVGLPADQRSNYGS